jgi:hypothetical protein
MHKAKLRPEGLIYSLKWAPKLPLEVGLIMQGWTCTYMQRNIKRINANHWMEVKTNRGMEEIVTWIKGPTFAMKCAHVQP